LINVLIIKENRNLPTLELDFEDIFNNVQSSISNTLINAAAVIETDFSAAPSVAFSSTYMESIFLNLLTNSVKYAHPERSLIVKVATKKDATGGTVLTFSDNGIGMNMEKVKDKIFGLYQRFHNNADSKGIGLYLIHSQIIALGGQIEVESEVNVGTTFTIYFK
jgi:signal transduction histidine kinase